MNRRRQSRTLTQTALPPPRHALTASLAVFIPRFSIQRPLKAVQHCLTFTRSRTHSHPDGGVSHAGRQPARQEQSGRGVSLRDTQLGGAGARTSDLPVTSQPALPPQPPGAPPSVFSRRAYVDKGEHQSGGGVAQHQLAAVDAAGPRGVRPVGLQVHLLELLGKEGKTSKWQPMSTSPREVQAGEPMERLLKRRGCEYLSLNLESDAQAEVGHETSRAVDPRGDMVLPGGGCWERGGRDGGGGCYGGGGCCGGGVGGGGTGRDRHISGA